MGPASYGPWPEQNSVLAEYKSRLENDGLSSRKITDLTRFCVKMRDGDLVVLRLGTNVVHAVGEIVGNYEYHEEFNDVDGWDIAPCAQGTMALEEY